MPTIGMHCLYCDNGTCTKDCLSSKRKDEYIPPERKMVFISSPYSHHDEGVRENNFILVSQLSADLNSKGIVAISPITYGHTLLKFKEMPSDWNFWKEFCLTILDKCSEMIVYKMPGWEESVGMKEEIAYAIKLNIPIKYIEYKN